MKHYAIENNRKRTKYALCWVKQIFKGGTCLAIHKVFRTVSAAIQAALLVGIEVEAVGDLYDILGIAG